MLPSLSVHNEAFGEAPAANQGFGVDPFRIHEIAAELADVKSLDIEIAIVVGGGNFFRGVAEQAKEMDRVSADHMGMLATVLNALALQDALEKQGVYTRVQTAIEMNQVAEPFIRRRAIRHLEKGRGGILPAGRAILISPPTQPPRYGQWRSRLTRF